MRYKLRIVRCKLAIVRKKIAITFIFYSVVEKKKKKVARCKSLIFEM